MGSDLSKVVATLFLASLMSIEPALAQQTVKIGLVMTYSGVFADAATQMDNGIKLYIKEHGDTVAGKKVEIVRKDVGNGGTDIAKRLAQELVVRDKVDILAGFVTTPTALASADISKEAKSFMVIMNAGTSLIPDTSPYIVRTSYTISQTSDPLARWAYSSGIRKVYSMVLDLAPGRDSEDTFRRVFTEAGGEIVGSVRFGPQSGFLRLRPACEGSQSGSNLRVRAGWPAARSARQGARGTRNFRGQDQGAWQRCADR